MRNEERYHQELCGHIGCSIVLHCSGGILSYFADVCYDAYFVKTEESGVLRLKHGRRVPVRTAVGDFLSFVEPLNSCHQ